MQDVTSGPRGLYSAWTGRWKSRGKRSRNSGHNQHEMFDYRGGRQEKTTLRPLQPMDLLDICKGDTTNDERRRRREFRMLCCCNGTNLPENRDTADTNACKDCMNRHLEMRLRQATSCEELHPWYFNGKDFALRRTKHLLLHLPNLDGWQEAPGGLFILVGWLTTSLLSIYPSLRSDRCFLLECHVTATPENPCQRGVVTLAT